MKDFKFFKGTLNMVDGETRATASFNADTPEGHMHRRHLYHTDRNLYNRLNNPFNNNEMERYYYDHGLGRFESVSRRPEITQEEVTRRINGGQSFLTGTSKVTINPKWWMKIKIVLQETWRVEPIGLVMISTMVTIVTIIGIAKILSIW